MLARQKLLSNLIYFSLFVCFVRLCYIALFLIEKCGENEW